MKAWIRSVSEMILWCAGAAGAAGACSDDTPPAPQDSSATHFLELCVDTCPSGLECICGVCTKPCTDSSSCSSITPLASCFATSLVQPTCSGSTSHSCDVPCSANTDCTGLAGAPQCNSGFCRASSDASVPVGDAAMGTGGAGGRATGGGAGLGGGAGAGGNPDRLDGGVGGRAQSSGGLSNATGGASTDGASTGGAGGIDGGGRGGGPGSGGAAGGVAGSQGTGAAGLGSSGGAGGGASGSGGADGGTSDSSVPSDGGVTGPTGHLILIGDDYADYNAQDQRILQNAVFLHSEIGNVRVVEYVQYTKDSMGAGFSVTAVESFLTDYATAHQRAVTFDSLDDYTVLDQHLIAADVLLVYDQWCSSGTCGGGAGAMPTLQTLWNPILRAFLARGGIVIVLSGNQGPAAGASGAPDSWGETFRVVSNQGLMYVPAYKANVGYAVLADNTDPLAAGVTSPLPTLRNSYMTFPGAVGGRIVVRDVMSQAPIVLHAAYSKCTSSLDCINGIGSLYDMCDLPSGKCVQCKTDLECEAGKYCSKGTCLAPSPCTTFVNCMNEPEGRKACDPTSATCVECVTSTDCSPGQTCAAGHVCRTPCTQNSQCAALNPTRICDTSAGACVECLDATQCNAGEYCELGRCVTDTCVAGTRACSANTAFECDPTGKEMTNGAACGIDVCIETGSTTRCVGQYPDGGPSCPLTCRADFCSASGIGRYLCCTPQATCGCFDPLNSTCHFP